MNKIRTAIIRNGVIYKVKHEDDIEIPADDAETDDLTQPQLQELQVNDDIWEEEPSWDHTSTDIFINECVKRKEELQNPNRFRRKIFGEIRLEMMAKGYNFEEVSLDRKFRNLKSRFFYIKENCQPGSSRVSWLYFEQMNEIFTETRHRQQEKVVNRVVSSLQKTIPKQQKEISESPKEVESNPIRANKTRKPRYNPNKLETLRVELLAFEERRTIAIEAIAEELKEANRVAREKLELEKQRMALNTPRYNYENGIEEEDEL